MTRVIDYDPRDWYWIVAGDESRVWSSAAAAYVPADDGSYAAWLAGSALPTRIVSEEELDAVLLAAGYGQRAPHPRWLVPKSTILSRITDAQLAAALALMTPRQQERWRAPDHPAVYNDDPDTVAIVTAIGADPAVALAS